MTRKLTKVVALLAGLVLAGLAAQVAAQDGATPDVTLATDADYGAHLATPGGNSLYLYVEDGDGASACVDACSKNWPALLVGDDGVATVGEGLDQNLVATYTRPDGAVQVTYGGHPLYTFRRDTAEGTTRGQKLGDAFFLVSPRGEAITEKLPQQKVELAPEELEALMTRGGQLFAANCAVCHGAEGGGGIGPALAGNSIVGNTPFIAERIINGFIEHGMPGFGTALDDHEIAAVATFVRNSWGNDFGAVLDEEVSAER